MKKYNLKYIQRTAALCFGTTLPICIIFFIVSFFVDNTEYAITASLFTLMIALICWILLLLRLPFAIWLFNYQIKTLNIVFDDESAKVVSKGSGIYLSDNWFIYPGVLILHKDFIISVPIKTRRHRHHLIYYLNFKCINDKKYTIPIYVASDAKKIKAWFKQIKTQ